MKTTYPGNGWFRLLNLLIPLLTILVFWVINAPYRLYLPSGSRTGLIDLLVLTSVTVLACGIVWVIDQQNRLSVLAKLGFSLAAFLLLAPLTGWGLYYLSQLPFFQTPFLLIDLPLGLPVFIAWASTYFLRQRLHRIETQNQAIWGNTAQKKGKPSLGVVG